MMISLRLQTDLFTKEGKEKNRISSIKKLIHSQEKENYDYSNKEKKFFHVDFSWQIQPLSSLD